MLPRLKRRLVWRVLLLALIPIVALLVIWFRGSEQREALNGSTSRAAIVGDDDDRNQAESSTAAPASRPQAQDIVSREPAPVKRDPVVVPDWHREMVLIPPIAFTLPAFGMEAPVTNYTEAFYIDRYEVSCLRYQAFLNATEHSPPESGFWQGDRFPDGAENLPACRITWEDAAAFAKWEGKRLPTVFEWELATGGTDGRKYPWGNEGDVHTMRNFANVDRILDRNEAFHDGLMPIDSYPNGVSPFGVFNMVGNVIEWTADDDGWGGHFLKGSIRNSVQGGGPGAVEFAHVGFRCAKSVKDREAQSASGSSR
jgi:formylglycine-generating enzyme required for sulfatase activity